MCVYLRAKFQVSSIILTSFRQGVILDQLTTSITRSIKKEKKDKDQTQKKYKHSIKQKRKIPYVKVKQKNAKS